MSDMQDEKRRTDLNLDDLLAEGVDSALDGFLPLPPLPSADLDWENSSASRFLNDDFDWGDALDVSRFSPSPQPPARSPPKEVKPPHLKPRMQATPSSLLFRTPTVSSAPLQSRSSLPEAKQASLSAQQVVELIKKKVLPQINPKGGNYNCGECSQSLLKIFYGEISQHAIPPVDPTAYYSVSSTLTWDRRNWYLLRSVHTNHRELALLLKRDLVSSQSKPIERLTVSENAESGEDVSASQSVRVGEAKEKLHPYSGFTHQDGIRSPTTYLHWHHEM